MRTTQCVLYLAVDLCVCYLPINYVFWRSHLLAGGVSVALDVQSPGFLICNGPLLSNHILWAGWTCEINPVCC